MKITFKRAFFMLMTAVLLCSAAVLIEKIDVSKRESAPVMHVEEIDTIEKFRMERQQLRAMQKAQLNDIVHDAAADEETAALARRQLIEICDAEEKELTIEGVLEMRGFKSPVVTVHGGSVNVLIRAEAVTKQESSVILDLVCRETGALSGDIKIIPIN